MNNWRRDGSIRAILVSMKKTTTTHKCSKKPRNKQQSFSQKYLQLNTLWVFCLNCWWFIKQTIRANVTKLEIDYVAYHHVRFNQLIENSQRKLNKIPYKTIYWKKHCSVWTRNISSLWIITQKSHFFFSFFASNLSLTRSNLNDEENWHSYTVTHILNGDKFLQVKKKKMSRIISCFRHNIQNFNNFFFFSRKTKLSIFPLFWGQPYAIKNETFSFLRLTSKKKE